MQSTSKQAKAALQDNAPRVQTKSGSAGKSSLQTIRDDEEAPEQQPSREKEAKHGSKIKLRLDAFLGEWLTPEYYESITHPPDTKLMLAGAKSELLRRGEYVESPGLRAESKKGYLPGMWGSPDLQPQGNKDMSQEGLSKLSLNSSSKVSTRDRASTQGSVFNSRAAQDLDTKTLPGGYLPPTPRYAVSPSDPIPKGYVAHARDACVDVDYQWDSSRTPQEWGDGGSYGEEWSAMHKRFRNGLQRMIHWYRIHQASALRQIGHPRNLHPIHAEESDDDDVDTVLVLVTHGAGCNALIGALTDQPVLLDVGMASLTMAVWKERPEDPASQSFKPGLSSPAKTSNLDVPLSAEYNVVITASVEHLRADTTPLTIPILQQPNHQVPTDLLSAPRFTQRRTFSNPHPKYRLSNSSIVTTSPIDVPTSPEATTTWSPTSSGSRQGSLQRSDSITTRPRSVTGLWTAPQPYVHPSSVLARAETAKAETKATAAVADGGAQPPPPPPPTRETSRQAGVPTLASVAAGKEKDNSHEETGSEAIEDEDEQGEARTGEETPRAETGEGGERKGQPLWDPKPATGQPGLWNPVGPEVRERMEGPKRRWTVNDQ